MFKIKNLKRNILILLTPIIIVIVVNEASRLSNKSNNKNHCFYYINTSTPIKNKCTWHCHNATTYCIENHTKLAKPYLKYTNPIYFGIINSFKSTGNYGLANIVFLVILIPFWMYYFLVKSISLILEIRKIKKWKH